MKTIFLTKWCALPVLATAFLAGIYACDKQENEPVPDEPDQEEPVPELENQFTYNGSEWTDIKSVIHEHTDSGYTFYLSPSEGVTTVIGMIEADDFIQVHTLSADGEIDVQNDEFSISYRDLSVDNASDMEEITLSVTLDEDVGMLELALDMTANSGDSLAVDYSGYCPPATEVELVNQYEIDRTIYSIGSAVLVRDLSESQTTYFLYEESGITETDEATAAITISLSDELIPDGESPMEIDFSTADLTKVSVTCGNFAITPEVSIKGTLTVTETVVSGARRVLVSMDATADGRRLRIECSREYTCSYVSDNYFRVTDAEGSVALEETLEGIFCYTGTGSTTFWFGAEGIDVPAAPETGYVATISMVESLIGSTVDLNNCHFLLYDYVEYMTWDSSVEEHGAEGTVTVIREGDNVYASFSVELANGLSAEGEWYGPVTQTLENPDITPVRPYEPQIIITNSSGENLLGWEIIAMQVRHQKDFRDSGTGDMIDAAYILYFITDMTESSGGVDNANGTPYLVIPDSAIPSDNVDLVGAGDGILWSFQFNNSNLSGYSGYGYNNSWSTRCPQEATLTVTRNGSDWSVRFSLLDLVEKYGSVQGTGNTLTLGWEGPASVYTGTKDNDMTDEDY